MSNRGTLVGIGEIVWSRSVIVSVFVKWAGLLEIGSGSDLS